MSLYFEEVNGIQKGAGIKTVIYGQEGVGKTSLAACFPGSVFIDCEGSTTKMNLRRLPKPTSWEMLKQELQYILENHKEKGYQTVNIDTFDWAERLAIQELCNEHKVNGIEGLGYGKGWEYEAEKIGRFLDYTEDLIKAGINVTLLCHAITRKASIPEADAEFDHWELKLGNKTTNKIAPLLKEWSDMTLFLAFKTNVMAIDSQGKKHKATSCSRVMYTTKTAWWDAKNRFCLPDELPLAYESITAIFSDNTAISKQEVPVQHMIDKAVEAGIPVSLNDAQQVYPPDPNNNSEPWDKPETSDELQTQHILDGIAPELAQLMAASQVTPEEIQAVVSIKGYFPADMPVKDYPMDFVNGWILVWWQQITEMVKENRIKK